MELKKAISSKSPVEWVDEESYFFKLSKWQKPLLEYYKNNPNFIFLKVEKMKLLVL